MKNGKIGRMIVGKSSPAKKKRKSPKRRKRKSPKKTPCTANKIRNPKTGRCVLRRGKIGQQILRGEI